MGNTPITITVYGAEQICASCVGAPGSKDTYEWLQAAIARKYADQGITYQYVDMDNPPEDKQQRAFVQKIWDEDLFYPVVLVNDEIVAEGITMLKTVYEALEKNGAALRQETK